MLSLTEGHELLSILVFTIPRQFYTIHLRQANHKVNGMHGTVPLYQWISWYTWLTKAG